MGQRCSRTNHGRVSTILSMVYNSLQETREAIGLRRMPEERTAFYDHLEPNRICNREVSS